MIDQVIRWHLTKSTTMYEITAAGKGRPTLRETFKYRFFVLKAAKHALKFCDEVYIKKVKVGKL